jgi:putative glutamine amidotransferase
VRRPLIGITPSPSEDTLAHGTFHRYVLNAAYADAIIAAGGIPLMLPFQEDTALLLDQLDGLLFSGGADLDPSLFAAESVHPATYGVSPARDAFELGLIRRAIARDTPLLCICRGIQLLNVALGGTLIQDIPSEYRTGHPVSHRQHELGIEASDPGHVVHLAAGNPLSDRVGSTALPVNSFHHQAIDQIASDLTPTAWAEDGVIEAVVMPSRDFVLGVQWHPELMFATHPTHLAPFRALVDAAEARLHQSQAIPA